MSTKQKHLIIFPKGTLSERDRTVLRREGYLPVETDDPSKIVLPDFTPSVQAKDLLLAFADGLRCPDHEGKKTAAMSSLLKRLRVNLGETTP